MSCQKFQHFAQDQEGWENIALASCCISGQHGLHWEDIRNSRIEIPDWLPGTMAAYFHRLHYRLRPTISIKQRSSAGARLFLGQICSWLPTFPRMYGVRPGLPLMWFFTGYTVVLRFVLDIAKKVQCLYHTWFVSIYNSNERSGQTYLFLYST